MLGRNSKKSKEINDISIGDCVLYVDQHGEPHAALIIRRRQEFASVIYLGLRGKIVHAHGIPRGKPATRRGDYWDLKAWKVKG